MVQSSALKKEPCNLARSIMMWMMINIRNMFSSLTTGSSICTCNIKTIKTNTYITQLGYFNVPKKKKKKKTKNKLDIVL